MQKLIESARRLLEMGEELAQDESGLVMAEYTTTFLATVPLTCFFLHPDNGLYEAARQQFEWTAFALTLPWG